MKIMGHRGSAGLALENTLDGFEIAKILQVDYIELDIHATKDGKLAVVHDSDLKRIAKQDFSVKENDLGQIQNIELIDGVSKIPNIEQVLKITDNIPLVIEIKSENCLDQVVELISDNPDRDFYIASFKHSELKKLKQKNESIKIFALERTKPIDIIQFARSNKLHGVGLNYWLLNPLTYLLAKRHNLEIYVYTVNNKIIGRLIGVLYPRVIICTDYPQRFLKNNYPIGK